MLYYASIDTRPTGWSVCNTFLREAIKTIVPVSAIYMRDTAWNDQALNGQLFTPIINHHLRAFCPARGKLNFGYAFIEFEPSQKAVERAVGYEVIFVGSSWGKNLFEEKGVRNARILLQGIDHTMFYPQVSVDSHTQFRIFSGGKFEYRKGQDLVLAAFKILQRKYDDMVLVTAWENMWRESRDTMSLSSHIKYEPFDGRWADQLSRICQINDIKYQSGEVEMIELVAQAEMATIYNSADIGIFPSRCEGGTNLMLMEFMACGKPVIASDYAGHVDIINDENSLRLRPFDKICINLPDGTSGVWADLSVDEIVNAVEFLYHDRRKRSQLGENACQAMKRFSWSRSAAEACQLMKL